MQNPIRGRGIRSLGIVVAGALALAVGGGVALTHAAVPGPPMWGWHSGTWHGGHVGMWNGGHVAGWGWVTLLFGLLWMAVLVGVPVLAVAWLVGRSRRRDRAEDSAVAVLREQYARGELDDEEFERRRSRLLSDGGRD
ncbi:SHOCT domain-containing protein [Halobacterium yunchengense]|uniref:SHOCT domain-containing protein n=1 Tax=Halobacterium yunchengense TaxID=3108497 RepID=UPI00300B859B